MISDGSLFFGIEAVKKTTVLNLKYFMKNYNLKNNTMNESDLKRVYKYNIFLSDSKIFSDKGF